MKIAISLDELRKNLTDVAGQVMYGNNTVFVKKYNRTGMVLLSEKEYEFLLDPTKRLSQKRWQEKFKTIDKIRASMPDIDPEVAEREINEAVRVVRAEKRALQTS